MRALEKIIKEIEHGYSKGEFPYGDYKDLILAVKKVDEKNSVIVRIDIISEIKKVGAPFVRRVRYDHESESLSRDPYEIMRKYDSRKMTITLKGVIIVPAGAILEIRGAKAVRGIDIGYQGKEALYYVKRDGTLELLGSAKEYSEQVLEDYLRFGETITHNDEVPYILKR